MRALVRKILAAEGARGGVDVTFVDAKRMRKLNRKYRGKDKTTDVLAFSYDEGDILGDVVISKEEANVKQLIIHGTLHVLGYEHGRKMSRAEKIYAQL